MSLTKKDILEQKSRMTKTDYTIDLVCGCYVDKRKKKLLNFSKEFPALQKDMLTQYLDIVRKLLCSALGSNTLELKFQQNSRGEVQCQFLKSLVSDKLQTTETLDHFYDCFIESYKTKSNYLILIFHDTYPELLSGGDDTTCQPVEQDYLIFAVCPVDRSMHALACETDSKEIELTEKNWIVGKPDLGFIYPPMISHRVRYDSLVYYVNTGKESHPEIIDRVLGCINQRTALEEREKLHELVSEAFDDVQIAENTFLQLQKALCDLALENELSAQECESDDPDKAMPELTPHLFESCLDKIYMPDDTRLAIIRSFEREFGMDPPITAKIADKYLIKRSLQQLRILQLEDQVRKLSEELIHKDSEIEALRELLEARGEI